MRFGLLADSHGRQRTTAEAVRLLLQAGAERLIHLGDFETTSVIDELVGHDATGVLGNCDYPPELMLRHARHVGVLLEPQHLTLEAEGKRLLATHGHLNAVVVQAMADRVDYLLHGHTHELSDERIGPTRVICPGALSRARRYTAAVLDTSADSLEVIEIPHDLD